MSLQNRTVGRSMRKFAIALLALWAGGCTAPQGYEFVREAGESKARCERELTVAAQRQCEAAYQDSYQDYHDARQEVLTEEGKGN
jgi:hypothetical protein